MWLTYSHTIDLCPQPADPQVCFSFDLISLSLETQPAPESHRALAQESENLSSGLDFATHGLCDWGHFSAPLWVSEASL